jgi:hypothetical protein
MHRSKFNNARNDRHGVHVFIAQGSTGVVAMDSEWLWGIV